MNKLKKYLPFIFFGSMGVFFIIREVVIKHRLKADARYTIGTIEKIGASVDGGPTAEYHYEVNNKKYSGLFDMPPMETRNPPRKPQVRDRFLVKYYTKDPAVSYPYYERLVDSGIAAPDSGWLLLPNNVLQQ